MFKKLSVFLMVMLLVCTSATVFAKPKKVIKFLNWYQNDGTAFTDRLKAIVQKSMPDVTLELETITWNDLDTIMQARAAGRNIPDILDFKGQDIPKYAAAGLLLELTGKSCLKNSPTAVLTNLRYKDKDYGLPYTAAYQGVFYNRKIFKENKLTIPKTHDELMTIVKKLKDKGVIPFAAHYKDWMIHNINMQMGMAEVFSKNPRWGYDLYAGKVSFVTSPEWKNISQWIKDVHDYSWKDPFSVEFPDAAARFAKGEAAMYISGTWNTTNLTINPNFDYGIFPYPGTAPGAKLIFEPDHTFAISSKTKYPKETLKILQIVATNKELAKLCIDKLGSNSLIKGIKPTQVNPATADIAAYTAKNQVVDVSIGNVQIKAAYQAEYARIISDWILGKNTLEQALKETDNFKSKVKLQQ